MNVLLAERPAVSPTASVRVMVVDDSVVVRGLVARWIDEERDLHIVAALRTGREAVDQFERFDPDVVILDIEMPELDGLSALPLLLAKKPDLVVIMASALSRRHAEVSIKALSLGAADYVPKPATNRDVTTSPAFRRELVEKVRQLGRRQAARRAGGRGGASPARRAPMSARSREIIDRSADVSLRPFAVTRPRVLLMGASTGGPQALAQILPELKGLDRVPILIVQHMPPTFTTILAEHLSRTTGRRTHEAVDGEAIQPGATYLAPGGRHMRVERRFGQLFIALDDGPAVNFCKPALDPLFASASMGWGSAVLATILTGMGSDGTGGAEAVVAGGGNVIAQDEATSVVWGMPGSAAHAGLCAAVLPLNEIGKKITRVFAGDFA